MRSRMLPNYYLSQEIFDRERDKIFRKLWLFVGLKPMLTRNNAFITRKIAGLPIVIQNFRGTLRAFENVCLHRSAPLQQGHSGCRPLVCPYHAWRYDEHGKVAHIPDCDAIYRFSETEKQNLALRQFALREVGGLVFINLDNEPLPIEEQFTKDFLHSLESSSLAYDSEVMVTTWHAKFNWKLVYENLRDFNHVRYIHPKSLGQALTFERHASDALQDEASNPLTDRSSVALRREMQRFSQAGAEDGNYAEARRYAWMDQVQPWQDANGYFNWLAYPNLHIASGTGGCSFSIENHIPIGPDQTDVEIYYLTARKKAPYPTSHQVLLSHMHYSKKVVGEDIAILEAIQSNLHAQAPLPNQGAYETANRLVERWYTTLMENDHAL